MTSDKNKSHSLQQSGLENKPYALRRGKAIHKKPTLKQQKQKLLNKCSKSKDSKKEVNNSKVISCPVHQNKINQGVISDSESHLNEDSNQSFFVNTNPLSNSSSIQQSSSQSKQKLRVSTNSNYSQVKQEELDITENNSCLLSASPQQSSVNSDQVYIRNRINHEPMLFLHNKWEILPNKDYNIFGDILIETDFVSDKKFSSQNHWKPPLNVEVHPGKLINRMNIGSYGTTMRDFSIISNFMKMCNHDEIQSYAHNLDRWQQVCNKLILSKQRSSILKSNNFASSTSSTIEEEDEIYAARLKEFEQQCNQTFAQLNNQGKIFLYSKKRYNIHSQNLEEYEFGFNQFLLAIMGCENEHLSTIVMRQGRPNFFDTKSRLKISQQLVLNYLNINQSVNEQIASTPEILQKVNLITFDDLQVPSTAYSYCLNFKNCKVEESRNLNSSFSSGSSSSSIQNNTDYDFVLQIIELDTEAQNISTLLNIREFNDHEQKIIDLKENIQYDFDIHILLQKYYKPINNSNPNQTNNQFSSFEEPCF
ncbi:hypothetical protein ABPG72_003544 [Tetrahymena utriculariae]